jgi:hypothetical protein
MANAVSGVSNVQQANQPEVSALPPKPAAKSTAAPKDTVNISAAGQQASHQAQAVSNSTQPAASHNKPQAKK